MSFVGVDHAKLENIRLFLSAVVVSWCERQAKNIICKFTRRLTSEQVMLRRWELNEYWHGLQEDISLDQVGTFDHLTPRLQSFLADAKKLEESCNYAFC